MRWVVEARSVPTPANFTVPAVGFQMTETVPVARRVLSQPSAPPSVAHVAWTGTTLGPSGSVLVGKGQRRSIILKGWPVHLQAFLDVEQAHVFTVTLDPSDGSLQIDNGPKAPLQLVDDVLVGSFAAAFPSSATPAGTVVTVSLYRLPAQPVS
jgi:hypothetical protein